MIQLTWAYSWCQFHEYVFCADIYKLLEMHCKHLESSKSEQCTTQDSSRHSLEQTVEFLHLLPLSSLLWLMVVAHLQ